MHPFQTSHAHAKKNNLERRVHAMFLAARGPTLPKKTPGKPTPCAMCGCFWSAEVRSKRNRSGKLNRSEIEVNSSEIDCCASTTTNKASLRDEQICTVTARPPFWFFPKQTPRGDRAYETVLLRGAIYMHWHPAAL